jgi:hypothetical protein
MRRKAKTRRRRWTSMVGAVLMVVLAAASAAAAKALNERSAEGLTRVRQPIAAAVTSAAAKTRKPRPSRPPHRTTTTTSPSTTATTSATTTTSPSTPGRDVKIPLPRFSDILVDEARGHIYISGGKGTSGIVVTDLEGTYLRTLEVAAGPAGMTLSPDGTKLYVAASGSDGIIIIDAETHETGWYWTGTPLGDLTCPRDVAVAAGQLWFSWGCEGSPSFGIGRVDPQTREFDLTAYTADERIHSPSLLAALPSQPNMLLAGATGTNPALLFRFEATPTGLEQRAWRRTDGGSVLQLAVTPDGSQVIVPSGYPYYHPVLRSSDLAEVHRYPTTHYPNAVAIRPDGLVAAGIDGAYDEDIYVFEPGGTTPIATFEFGHLPGQYTWAHTLADGGLAWAGDRIYAITEQLSEPYVTLRIRVLPATP